MSHYQPHFIAAGGKRVCNCSCEDCHLRLTGICVCPDCECESAEECAALRGEGLNGTRWADRLYERE